MALCPRCHRAWTSEGTPIGPGKDTHSTLGPEWQEGCGLPVWIRQQIHGKNFFFCLFLRIFLFFVLVLSSSSSSSLLFCCFICLSTPSPCSTLAVEPAFSLTAFPWTALTWTALFRTTTSPDGPTFRAFFFPFSSFFSSCEFVRGIVGVFFLLFQPFTKFSAHSFWAPSSLAPCVHSRPALTQFMCSPCASFDSPSFPSSASSFSFSVFYSSFAVSSSLFWTATRLDSSATTRPSSESLPCCVVLCCVVSFWVSGPNKPTLSNCQRMEPQ